MSAAVASNTHAGTSGPDDLDNILNYDAAVDDFLKDLPINNETSANGPTEPQKNVDEEITVKRKRKPVPKLDENLLLSSQGIPRLRKISKERLKLRGKGHEFNDIGRMLNMYQLWMDDMYPRAKFRDAMAMVEKVGHSRRMQVMRRVWLDETKPKVTAEAPEDAVDESRRDEQDVTPTSGNHEEETAPTEDAETTAPPAANTASTQDDNIPDDDELDALLAEDQGTAQPANARAKQAKGPFEEDDDESGDELDALLDGNPAAERDDQTRQDAQGPSQGDANHDDELDALLAEQEDEEARNKTGGMSAKDSMPNSMPRDFADEEEAMAEMGDLW